MKFFYPGPTYNFNNDNNYFRKLQKTEKRGNGGNMSTRERKF